MPITHDLYLGGAMDFSLGDVIAIDKHGKASDQLTAMFHGGTYLHLQKHEAPTLIEEWRACVGQEATIFSGERYELVVDEVLAIKTADSGPYPIEIVLSSGKFLQMTRIDGLACRKLWLAGFGVPA